MNQEQREDQKLHDLLNAPKAPEDLAEKLKANLDKQMLEAEQSANLPQRNKALWYGFAASLTLAIFVALQFQKPDLVSQAYAHVQEEANLVGAVDGGYQKWFEATGLQIPSQANRIALSKNCALGEQKAKHLRFELPNSGTINLFLYQDDENLPDLAQTDGTIANQSWITESPRDGIHLLALYDANVSKQQITQIIQSIFKDQSA